MFAQDNNYQCKNRFLCRRDQYTKRLHSHSGVHTLAHKRLREYTCTHPSTHQRTHPTKYTHIWKSSCCCVVFFFNGAIDCQWTSRGGRRSPVMLVLWGWEWLNFELIGTFVKSTTATVNSRISCLVILTEIFLFCWSSNLIILAFFLCKRHHVTVRYLLSNLGLY